ncbi:MAG: heat-shock protein, partial [Rhizobiales bacterium]|nr:heat-shock protein [Rhizobacter sp.]
MFCAIDFGTSNSAIAIPQAAAGMRLVELEAGQTTMPTAVFYFVEGPELDGPPRAFGRAAVAAYVDGLDGRLMRSMKSILGSNLIDQTTDVGGGRGAKYLDIVAGYLKHLKGRAEAEAGLPIRRAVLGRPVFFVDDDSARDAQAQAALEAAARQVGFDDIHFQYEPIAAA